MPPDEWESRVAGPDGAGQDVPVAQHLRAATRTDHDAVDTTFARFSLSTRKGYRAFLSAHARVLPRAERLLDPAALIGNWTGRSAALQADLVALGGSLPTALPFALPEGAAARWGALYVLEGSRLGGAFLQRRVPSGLPTRFLGSIHAPGAWQTLLSTLNEADEGAAWRERAIEGAKALFAAYIRAADVAETQSHAERAIDAIQIPAKH